MAPKYPCPCFICKSGTSITEKTLLSHLKRNQSHLDKLKTSGAHQGTIKPVEDCNYNLMTLTSSLARGSHAGQSYPHGEHLISYNTIDYLLICFDLADAHIASPPLSEGELSVDEGPHAGQSVSPYLHGEHLISYDLHYVLICFDLANAPIASPSFSEGELADDDARMLDDDGE